MRIQQQEASSAPRGLSPWRRVRLVTWISAVLLAASVLCSQSALGQIIPSDELEVRTTDLIRLAGSYADAVGELKVAKIRVATLTALSQTSLLVSRLEIDVAKINVQTAETKIAVLRAIAEKELAAAQAKLEMLRRLEKAAEKLSTDATDATATATAQTKPMIAQAEATVRILQMILAIK